MKTRDYFPLGKAAGKAFCNRTVETTWVLKNLQAGKHSLIIAPRRFGKSSLADRAIKQSGLPVESLSFNICSDPNDVEMLLRQGVSELIGKALGPVDKIMHSIKNYVSYFTPKLILGPTFARLELSAQSKTSPALYVEEALTLLDRLLTEKKKSAVLLLDEFQIVGVIAKGTGIEAAIRNAAEKSRNLSIIFSGSSRSLLQEMFEDDKRPLYKLCRKLNLKRIDALHYRDHLNKAAQEIWKRNLNDTVFEHIMLLSERHPYYVNYLCDVIWTECDSPPQRSDVDRAWHIVLEEEESDANAEISNLSLGQKKVVRYLAVHVNEPPTSVHASKEMDLALSSIAGAIAGLIEKDVIEKVQDGYQVINPVVKYYLSV